MNFLFRGPFYGRTCKMKGKKMCPLVFERQMKFVLEFMKAQYKQ